MKKLEFLALLSLFVLFFVAGYIARDARQDERIEILWETPDSPSGTDFFLSPEYQDELREKGLIGIIMDEGKEKKGVVK